MSGPVAVLEVVARLAGENRRIEVVATTPALVQSSAGVGVMADAMEDPAAVDTLIFTGGSDCASTAVDEQLLPFVRESARHARRRD